MAAPHWTNGAADATWETVGNWSTGAIPTTGDTVSILLADCAGEVPENPPAAPVSIASLTSDLAIGALLTGVTVTGTASLSGAAITGVLSSGTFSGTLKGAGNLIIGSGAVISGARVIATGNLVILSGVTVNANTRAFLTDNTKTATIMTATTVPVSGGAPTPLRVPAQAAGGSYIVGGITVNSDGVPTA